MSTDLLGQPASNGPALSSAPLERAVLRRSVVPRAAVSAALAALLVVSGPSCSVDPKDPAPDTGGADAAPGKEVSDAPRKESDRPPVSEGGAEDPRRAKASATPQTAEPSPDVSSPPPAGGGSDADEYARIKKEFEKAVAARKWLTAREKVREAGRYAEPDAGRPALDEHLPGIEAAEMTERARLLADSTDLANLRKAERLLLEAVGKDPACAEAGRMLPGVRSAIGKARDAEAVVRSYERAMQEGRSAEEGKDLDAAEGHYREAQRNGKEERRARASLALTRVKALRELGRTVADGDRALGDGRYVAAMETYSKARRTADGIRGAPPWVKGTSEALGRKTDAAMAKVIEKEGDAAADLATRRRKYQAAFDLSRDAALRARIAEIDRQTAAEGDSALLLELWEAGSRLRWAEVAKRAAEALEKRPDWRELKLLDDRFPRSAEISTASKAAWEKLQADLKKVGPADHARRQRLIQIALPALVDKYRSLGEKALQQERDAPLTEPFLRVKRGLAKLITPDQKIAFLAAQLPRFTGSGYEEQLRAMYGRAWEERAAKALAGVKARLAKAKTHADGIRLIDGALADRRFGKPDLDRPSSSSAPPLGPPAARKALEGLRRKERELEARQAHVRLGYSLRKVKTRSSKLAALEAAVNDPVYSGTAVLDRIKKQIEQEKRSMKEEAAANKAKQIGNRFYNIALRARKLKGTAKANFLLAERAPFLGSSYAEKIDEMIRKAKDPSMRVAYAEVLGNAELRVGQARIDFLSRELGRFAWTSYGKKIKDAIQREKDALASAKYGEARAAAAKAKDKVACWAGRLPAFQGTRYEEVIKAAIEAEQRKRTEEGFRELKRRVARAGTARQRLALLRKALPDYRRLADAARSAPRSGAPVIPPPPGDAPPKTKAGPYVREIEAMIARETAAERAGRYAARVAAVKSERDPAARVGLILSALVEFSGLEKYEAGLEKILAAEEKNVAKDRYERLMKDVAGKGSAAEKVQALENVLQLDKGRFRGTIFEKKVKAQIEKLRR